MIVIFGVRGDLAKRLLVPALYNLHSQGLLPDDFSILGVDHGDNDDMGIRRDLKDFLVSVAGDKDSPLLTAAFDPELWGWLESRITYQRGDFQDPATYQALARTLGASRGGCALFYMAVAPRFFGDIAGGLGAAGLMKAPADGFRRVVVEKPFGEDLESAQALNRRLRECMDESQIFRIDHFLGKEAVRNIMVTRFGNDVFEPLWSRDFIDSVQITAAETVGVEGRGSFYEKTGALRDMTPNHLCQMLGMVAMEPPADLGVEAVRAAKGLAIQSIRRLELAEARAGMAAGQYAEGKVAGHEVAAYRASKKVAPDSGVETFVALKLEIDNDRWRGVPFYLRTGKAMSAHDTQIVIRFKARARRLFHAGDEGGGSPNALVMRIQPAPGLSLTLDAKQPGLEVTLAPVSMDFRYADDFAARSGTGYETLVYETMIGDQTLFSRGEDIEAGWAAVMPFLDVLAGGGVVEPYAAGTDGPQGAADLLAREGRAWGPLG
jgi:glucose-6-phosphate 1-dehydrogenase